MATKVTYQLKEETVRRVKSAVRAGRAATMSEFVEQALAEKLERLRRESIRERIEAAGADPLYVADVQEMTEAYQTSAGDGLEELSR